MLIKHAPSSRKVSRRIVYRSGRFSRQGKYIMLNSQNGTPSPFSKPAPLADDLQVVLDLVVNLPHVAITINIAKSFTARQYYVMVGLAQSAISLHQCGKVLASALAHQYDELQSAVREVA